MIRYDPPGGWQQGFPRPYKPRKVKGKIEPVAATLKRDGYDPVKAGMGTMEAAAKRTRFIGSIAEYDEIAMLPKE